MISHSLRIFLKVAENKNITTTANELFISQPAVSKAIKILEQRLNVKLFHRDKRKGLILTDTGEKILLLARQMKNIEERIYQTAFIENNFLGGKVHVASVPIATTLILSKALPIYRAKYPAVKVELTEGTPAEVQKMLENYSADFAITYSPFETFDSEVLIEDEMVGIGSDKTVELHNCIENIIFCRAGFEVVRNLFKVDVNKNLVVQNAETAIKLVEEGNGVAIISKLVLSATRGNANICKVLPSIKTQLGLVAYNLNNLTPLASELVRIIKEVNAQRSS